jgi:prepilin-type N-terminal cleavage/methylation domain-containing protein
VNATLAVRGRERGLTLLEMLVTLVIVSFVVTIVAQAMGQVSRIERLLEGGQLRSMATSVRAEWVRAALASMLPGTADAGDRFRGDARSLRGLSAEAPGATGSVLATMQLGLEFDGESGATRLQLRAGDVVAGGAEAQATTLLSWPGNVGRFRYLDPQGEWIDQWPPPMHSADAATLPAAILVETGMSDIRLIIAAPQVSESPLPLRKQLEKM